MSQKIDIGGVIDEVFAIYRDNAGVLIPAAAVVFLIEAVVGALLIVISPILILYFNLRGAKATPRPPGGALSAGSGGWSAHVAAGPAATAVSAGAAAARAGSPRGAAAATSAPLGPDRGASTRPARGG